MHWLTMMAPSKAVEGLERLLDLIMLANSPSRQERTLDEYRDLLARAEFALVRVVPKASSVSVIEATPLISSEAARWVPDT